MNQLRSQEEINIEYTKICTSLGDIQCRKRRMVIEEMALEQRANELLSEKARPPEPPQAIVNPDMIEDPAESGV